MAILSYFTVNKVTRPVHSTLGVVRQETSVIFILPKKYYITKCLYTRLTNVLKTDM